MFRRTFLKHLVGATILLAGFREIPNFEPVAPEPISQVCGTCGGEEFIIVEVIPPQGIVSAAEYSYIPQPDGPSYERLACPSCNNPWSSAQETKGRKDAFEAHMTRYTQLISRKLTLESRRMALGFYP